MARVVGSCPRRAGRCYNIIRTGGGVCPTSLRDFNKMPNAHFLTDELKINQ